MLQIVLCFVLCLSLYFIPALSVGAAVKLAESKGIPLDKLSLEEMQTLHPLFAADVTKLWSYENRCRKVYTVWVHIYF